MKKRWSFLLLSIAIFALAGCSQKKNPDANVETEFSTTQESTTVSVSTEQTTPTETTKDNPSNQTIPAETNEKNKESISTESSDTATNTWDGYEDNFAVETETAGADETTLNPSRAGFTLYGPSGMPSITFSVQNGKLGISGINY